jgi:transcriptional regulator with XRE-family HTH domain
MDPLLSALRALYDDDVIAAALCESPTKSARTRALQRWETGVCEPRLRTLRRLAEELGCSLSIGPDVDTVRAVRDPSRHQVTGEMQILHSMSESVSRV